MLHETGIFLLVYLMDIKICPCCNCFIGSQMFHGSHVHFRVHIRVHDASRDMIEHGMMWNSILLCSYGIHIHMD